MEIVPSVKATQTSLRNNPDIARLQVKTFTSKLAEEIVKRRRQMARISLSEVVEYLVNISKPERTPVYDLRVARMGICIPNRPIHSGSQGQEPEAWSTRPAPPTLSGDRRLASSSSDSSESAGVILHNRVKVEFTAHIASTDAQTPEFDKTVEWFRSLHPSIGLSLTGVYQKESTTLILEVPWAMWMRLKWCEDLIFVLGSSGGNQLAASLPRLQETTDEAQKPE